MSIELGTLAATITGGFLVPYAKLGFEKVIESMGKKVGEKAAEHGGAVLRKTVERVTGLFESASDRSALALFQENPDEMERMFQKLVTKKLEDNPILARELSKLINEPGPNGIDSGAKIANAGIAGVFDGRGQNLTRAQQVTQAGVIVSRIPTQESGL